MIKMEFSADEGEDRSELVESPVDPMMQAQLDAHHGEDLVDEICTTEVDAGGLRWTSGRSTEESAEKAERKGVMKSVRDAFNVDGGVFDAVVQSEGFPQAQHEEDLWEEVEEKVNGQNVEEAAKKVKGRTLKRLKAERCNTPMCFKSVKPNDLGKVAKLCAFCIDGTSGGF